MSERMVMIAKIFVAVLGTGVVGGGLTYAVPLTSRRERAIRGYCAELLGFSADPARVTHQARGWVADFLDGQRMTTDHSRAETIRKLVATRMEIPGSENARALEDRTDELLERLRAEDMRRDSPLAS